MINLLDNRKTRSVQLRKSNRKRKTLEIANSIIGRRHIFIYLFSAQLISFEIECFDGL